MKRSILNILIDPSSKSSDFTLYASRLLRDSTKETNVPQDDIRDDDDIESGVLIDNQSGHAYPISDFVLSMLSDEDVDTNLYIQLFSEMMDSLPEDIGSRVRTNIERLKGISDESETGHWNRGEMEYYDEDVRDEATRKIFLDTIRTQPLWHIYLERKRHLTDKLKGSLQEGSRVLEVGCGNARSVSWILPPHENGYSYVGTDISFKRLILAKQVIPEGDFIQCSGLNLPFKPESFQAAIAFGVLHHLPDPVQGVCCALDMLPKNAPLLIHEPIDKPSQFFSGNRLSWLRKFFVTYEHSEHDNELDWPATLKLVREKNISISDLHLTVTILRTVAVRFFGKIPGIRHSKISWRTLIAIDDLFARIFCRTPNILGPGAVFTILRK